MKRYNLYTFLAVAILLVAGACTPKNKPLFDQSASDRTATTMAELQNKLLSSPNGWIAEYYPGKESGKEQYGGFVLSMIFTKEGDALISSEIVRGNDKKYTRGQYVVSADAGVSLNFVTYNKALHFFADPDFRVGQGVGKGYEGDYEFLYMEETSPDTILLRGKRQGQILKLFRPKTTADDYLEASLSIYNAAFDWDYIKEHVKDSYAGTIGGKEAVLYFDQMNTFYYEDAEGEGRRVSFVPTDKGIRFQKPVNGITELVYNSADGTFTAEGASLALREDPNYKYFVEYLGDYTLVLNKGSKNEVSYDVTFEAASSTTYKITCADWNYHIYANFDAANRRFSIVTQDIEGLDNTKLAAWALFTSEGGYLNWGAKFGMHSVKMDTEDGSIAYKMVDNGEWGSYKADSFILWEVGSGTSKKAKPNRIITPIFIKK